MGMDWQAAVFACEAGTLLFDQDKLTLISRDGTRWEVPPEVLVEALALHN